MCASQDVAVFYCCDRPGKREGLHPLGSLSYAGQKSRGGGGVDDADKCVVTHTHESLRDDIQKRVFRIHHCMIESFV